MRRSLSRRNLKSSSKLVLIGSRRTFFAILIGTILSRIADYIFPSVKIANFVSNLFILIPSVILTLASLLRNSISRALNLLSVYLVGVFVALPLVPAVFGGIVGLIRPSYYGKRGTVRFDSCDVDGLCKGQFKAPGMAASVTLRSEPADPLYPNREIVATGFERPGNRVIILYRVADDAHVALSTMVSMAVLLAWLIAIIGWRRGARSKFGSSNAFWEPATSLFQGRIFGRTCRAIGTLVTLVSVCGFVWTLGHDASLPSGSPAFVVLRLGAGDWLTILGLGLSLVAWGISEGSLPRLMPDVQRVLYATSIVYLLVTLVIASSYATGTAVRRLQLIETSARRATILQALGRLYEVFSPGVIMANLAVAVGLLALTLQMARIPTRPGSERAHRLELIRLPAVAEILLCLSSEQMSGAQIKQHLSSASMKKAADKALSNLIKEGWVHSDRQRPPRFRLSRSGSHASIALAQWLDG